MDGKLKQFIADNKFSDEQILKLLTQSVESQSTDQEEVDEQEEESTTSEAEEQSTTAEEQPAGANKEDVDIEKLVAAAVAKALKGKAKPKPKPTKKTILSNIEASGWGVIP